MKVSQLPYRRVTAEEFTAAADEAVGRVKNAKCAQDVLAAREDYLKMLSEFQTAEALSYMRYSINTADEFYLAEKDYYDAAGPEAGNAALRWASALLDSPLRPELEKALSPLLFKSMEVQRKSMSPEIVPDMVEENKLVSEYSQLMAGMEFEFRGEKLPRPMLMKYAKSDDPTACAGSATSAWAHAGEPFRKAGRHIRLSCARARPHGEKNGLQKLR
jgi:oligoendopeptidase F